MKETWRVSSAEGRKARQTDIIDNPGERGTRTSSALRRGRESSEKKGRAEKKKESREDTAPLRRAIFTRRVGFCEFQPQDLIAPAGYSDLLGYYGSCVRKVRPAWCMDFFQRLAISVAFQDGVRVWKKIPSYSSIVQGIFLFIFFFFVIFEIRNFVADVDFGRLIFVFNRLVRRLSSIV